MSVRRPPNSTLVSIVRNRLAVRVFIDTRDGGRQEARAVDDVGAAFEDRDEQLRVLRGIELEVGVLDEEDVAGGERQPHADRRALSQVDRAVIDMHGQERRKVSLVDGASRAVGGAVVRDDDLHLDSAQVHRGDPLEDLPDGLLFVVDRNDDG